VFVKRDQGKDGGGERDCAPLYLVRDLRKD